MPVGAEVTVPVPVPALTTVRVRVICVKVAVTVLAALITTGQVPVPVQAPLQPEKVAPPLCGVAVSVTEVP